MEGEGDLLGGWGLEIWVGCLGWEEDWGGGTWTVVGGVWAVSATTAASMVSACVVRAAVEVMRSAIVAVWTVVASENRRALRMLVGCISWICLL